MAVSHSHTPRMSTEKEQHRTHAFESLTARPRPGLSQSGGGGGGGGGRSFDRNFASRRYALTIDIDSPNERALRAMLSSTEHSSSPLHRRVSSGASRLSSAGARIIATSALPPIPDGHKTMSSLSPSSVASPNPTPPNFFLSRPTISQPRRPPVLKCTVCFELMPSRPGGIKTPTKRCTHAAVVCPDCLEKYVKSRITENGFTEFVCPASMCTEMLEYEDVRAAVQDHTVMERYEYLLLRRSLQGLDNFVWCKNPDCSSGQIHDSGSLCPTVTCKDCGAESCFVHDAPWHDGLTCSQYDSKNRRHRGEGIRANKKYLSKHAKACPNPSCGRMADVDMNSAGRVSPITGR